MTSPLSSLRRLGLRRRADGSTVIRPGGALILSALVWLLCGATILQALWLVGLDGVLFSLLPAVVAAVVGVILWAPRVVVRPERIEVRNVLVTHVLPMGSIERARLGAMLRFELVPATPGGTSPLVTAWNAPGVGRDRHSERLAASDPRARHGAGGGPRRPAWSERLQRDQRLSPSYPAVEAWEQWQREHPHGAQTAADAAPQRRLNVASVAVLGAGALARVARPVL